MTWYNPVRERTVATMADTITLTLTSDLKDSLLALSTDGETLEDVTARLLRKAVSEAVASDLERYILNHPAVKELLSRYKYNPNEMLPCGMTVGEYDSLSEEEQAALWDREMEKKLDRSEHEPERDASPTAITVRQRRAATLPPRAAKRRARKKNDR